MKWMLRYSRGGVGYGGHVHAPIGEWAECPRWTDAKTCDGGGFFGQGPGGYGYLHDAPDPEIAEYDGEAKIVDGDKIAVRRMCILARGQTALDMLAELCGGVWPGSLCVPSGMTCLLTRIGGNAYIRDGAQVPKLTRIGGNAYIREGAQVPLLKSANGRKYHV